MNSQCLKSVIHNNYSSLLAWISLNKSSASCQKWPCNSTIILIKPECLACLCVEQAFLYPWMCCTSWFELHRSQDERFSTPCQNASATAITIKPEHLAHSCVEQVFLYAWMCYNSWFELHISQDERFNSYHSATIWLCRLVRVGSVGGVCLTDSHMPYSCFGWRRELSGYVCFGFDLKVKCLSYLMIRKNFKKNLAGYSAVRSTDEWISFLDVTTSTLHSSDRTP